MFPATVPNLADQLGAAGHTWRAYLEDMGSPCRHPDAGRQRRHAVGRRSATSTPLDTTRSCTSIRSSTTKRSCASHVVDLEALRRATSSAASATPELRVHHAEPVPRRPRRALRRRPAGRPGLGATPSSRSGSRRSWRPTPSRQDGLLVITFDEAEPGSPEAAAACCGEIPARTARCRASYGPGRRSRRRGAALPLHRRRHASTTRPTTTTRCSAASRTSSASSHLGFAAR